MLEDRQPARRALAVVVAFERHFRRSRMELQETRFSALGLRRRSASSRRQQRGVTAATGACKPYPGAGAECGAYSWLESRLAASSDHHEAFLGGEVPPRRLCDLLGGNGLNATHVVHQSAGVSGIVVESLE